MKRGGFVAVGFPLGEDLSKLVAQPEALLELIGRTYPNNDPNYVRATLTTFVNDVAKGDLVVAADGTTILGIGRVVGDYEHDERGDGAPPDRRKVTWLDLNDWQAPLWGTRKFPEGYPRAMRSIHESASEPSGEGYR
jgi:5-methylcytosine-specific restriction protein B